MKPMPQRAGRETGSSPSRARAGAAQRSTARRAARMPRNLLQRGGLALFFRLALRLELLHPPADELALQRAQAIDEELALQVVHLVLHADGEQGVGRFLLLPLSVAVGVLDHDVAEARHLFVLVADGEAALGIGELALGDPEHRADEPEEPRPAPLRPPPFRGAPRPAHCAALRPPPRPAPPHP